MPLEFHHFGGVTFFHALILLGSFKPTPQYHKNGFVFFYFLKNMLWWDTLRPTVFTTTETLFGFHHFRGVTFFHALVLAVKLILVSFASAVNEHFARLQLLVKTPPGPQYAQYAKYAQ